MEGMLLKEAPKISPKLTELLGKMKIINSNANIGKIETAQLTRRTESLVAIVEDTELITTIICTGHFSVLYVLNPLIKELIGKDSELNKATQEKIKKNLTLGLVESKKFAKRANEPTYRKMAEEGIDMAAKLYKVHSIKIK